MTPTALRVALYARVSTSEQAKRGYSIGYQIERIHSWSEQNGHVVVAEYVDRARSAAEDKERPELNRLLADSAGDTFDLVVFMKIDRFARDLRGQENDIATLKANGKMFAATDESIGDATPEEVFSRQVKGAVSQLEHGIIRERTINGKRQSLKNGHWYGGPPPFGIIHDRNERVLVVNPDEAASIYRALELLIDENMTTGQAFRTLNAEGFHSRFTTWSQQSLRTWFAERSGHLSGTWNGTYLGEPFTTPCEPLVSAERHSQLIERMARTAHRAPRNQQRLYMLSSRLLSQCGTTMRGKYRNDVGTAQYRCPASGCGCSNVDQDVIESAVWQKVVAKMRDPEQLLALVGAMPGDTPDGSSQADTEKMLKAKLERLRTDTKAQIRKIATMSLGSDLMAEMVAEVQEELDREAAAIEQRLAQLHDFQARLAKRAEIASQMSEMMNNALWALDDPSPTQRRQMVEFFDVHARIEWFEVCPTCSGSKVVLDPNDVGGKGWKGKGGKTVKCPTCHHYGQVPQVSVLLEMEPVVGVPHQVKIAA